MQSQFTGRTTLFAMFAAAAAVFGGAAQAAEEIKLTISAAHAPVFAWVQNLSKAFIPTVDRELAKTGKYQIKWTEAYGGVLAKVGSELETVEEGISDLGIVNTLFHVARMPLQNISYVTPFGADDPAVLLKVADGLQESVPAMAEAWTKANQILLSQYGADSYQLMSVKPVSTAADLKGMKIAAPQIALPWLNGSGAVGVAGALPAYYNDIKSGLYSGVLSTTSPTLPIKLYEVAPNLTIINMGVTIGGGVSVNLNRWNKFAPEVKEALKTGAKAWSAAMYANVREREKAAMDAYRASGKIIEMSAAERRTLAQTIENPTKAWVAQNEARGIPAKEVLTKYMNAMRAAGVVFARDWDKE